MYQILLMAALMFPDHAASLGTGLMADKFDTVEQCNAARGSETFAKQKSQLAETWSKLASSKGGGAPEDVWIVDRCVQPRPGQPT